MRNVFADFLGSGQRPLREKPPLRLRERPRREPGLQLPEQRGANLEGHRFWIRAQDQ